MHQVYELNVRTWRSDRSAALGRAATLDDLPYEYLDHLVEGGFTWLYLLGVWRTGPLARADALKDAALLDHLSAYLPDFTAQDIAGSPMAISGYEVMAELGGDEALARLRDRAQACGLSLMLDFVPNHVGLDHAWAREHPEWFILGDEHRLRTHPEAWCRLHGRIFAHGRDPFFAPWSSTLQIDFGNPQAQEAVITEASSIASRCDGLRVDEAMLVLDDVFEGTWGRRGPAFWPTCLQRVRAEHPGTVFMAEVYWNLEYRLQQEGFDFTYDKTLYDRLLDGNPEAVRGHLRAQLDFQHHCVRFIENEDEQRAAARIPDPARHHAILLITGMVPGLLLCHHGQEDGLRLYCPLAAARRPAEEGSEAHRRSYRDLIALLAEPARHDGTWRLLEPLGHQSHALIACLWSLPSFHQLLVIVNLSGGTVEGAVEAGPLANRDCQFQDRLSGAHPFTVHADTLRDQGIWVRLGPWQAVAYRIMILR
jgi:hypothetical protein